jgi:hypothetical protein
MPGILKRFPASGHEDTRSGHNLPYHPGSFVWSKRYNPRSIFQRKNLYDFMDEGVLLAARPRARYVTTITLISTGRLGRSNATFELFQTQKVFPQEPIMFCRRTTDTKDVFF